MFCSNSNGDEAPYFRWTRHNFPFLCVLARGTYRVYFFSISRTIAASLASKGVPSLRKMSWNQSFGSGEPGCSHEPQPHIVFGLARDESPVYRADFMFTKIRQMGFKPAVYGASKIFGADDRSVHGVRLKRGHHLIQVVNRAVVVKGKDVGPLGCCL